MIYRLTHLTSNVQLHCKFPLTIRIYCFKHFQRRFLLLYISLIDRIKNSIELFCTDSKDPDPSLLSDSMLSFKLIQNFETCFISIVVNMILQ